MPSHHDAAEANARVTKFKYDRIEYTYNIAGNRLTRKDQNGTIHTYEYDDAGRVTHDRVTTLASGVDGAVRRVSTTYKLRGQREKITSYDSGTAGTYASFDRFGRVVQQLWYDYGASTNRDKFTYGYDRASNRLYRENTLSSGRDEFYSHDDANRLATFDRGNLNAGKTAIDGTPASEEDWGLDMTGNWSDFTQKTSGSTDLNQDRTHNDVNEITGITETVGTAWIDPVHDKAGNMTTLPKPSNPASELTCKWDAWNHLVEVKDGATVVAKYEYDGLTRRTKKHVDSRSKIQQVPTGSTPMYTFSTTAAGKCSKSATARWKTRSPESPQAKAQVPIRLVPA